MQTITINNNTYFLCTDLFDKYKQAFTGCKGRDVIKKKKLLDTDYIYAHNSKSGWKISTEDCKQAKVLISTKWKGFCIVEQTTTSTINTIEQSNTSASSNNTNESNNSQLDDTNVLNNSITVVEEINYPIAPDILDIEENEKFKDANGRTLDITIRGEREYDKCYFRVKDISKGFEIPRLQDVILDANKTYEINIHYKNFVIVYPTNGGIEQNAKEVYLTYKGMLKVLFCSRSGNAESFQDWAVKTLFTVQLGTEDSKYELVKSMFGGASIHAVKEAFKTSSGKTPCIYLFAIGNANKLLNTNQYSEDTLLYKFGNTDDLPRRSGEHERTFKKMFKINHIELMLFSVIDPKCLFEAESSLKDHFKMNKVDFQNTTELITLNNNEYEKAKTHYKIIKNACIGCYREMQDKIDQLERKIKEIQYECDLTKEKLTNANTLQTEKHKNTIQEKENELAVLMEKYNNLQKENDFKLMLKDKDIELLNLKLQLLQK
jgi:hypothetical protein